MWSLFILAIVQGLTEFFPVSSSGHLSLLEKFFAFNQQQVLGIGLVLHLGTVFSVLVFYRKIFFFFLKNFNKHKNFILYILVACIPTGIIGLLLKNIVENMVFNVTLIALFFFVTAVALLLSHVVCKKMDKKMNEKMNEKMDKKASKKANFRLDSKPELLFSSLEHLTLKKVFLIGCIQGLSVFPGLSRSGLTIAAGRLLGLPSLVAGFFSFALMVPVILGASLLEFSSMSYISISLPKMFIGFSVSFLIGLVVLKLLQYILVQDKFYYFAYYLFLLGMGILII